MVHEDTLIIIDPSLLRKGFIMIHLVCTNVGDARIPCTSQLQLLRTLNRSNGTKKNKTLPALLLLLEEFEAFQQCHGNSKFTFLLHIFSNTILIK
jgi:hypothetical protein